MESSCGAFLHVRIVTLKLWALGLEASWIRRISETCRTGDLTFRDLKLQVFKAARMRVAFCLPGSSVGFCSPLTLKLSPRTLAYRLSLNPNSVPPNPMSHLLTSRRQRPLLLESWPPPHQHPASVLLGSYTTTLGFRISGWEAVRV